MSKKQEEEKMLVNMKEMLQDAQLHNYAIGSLNTPNLETLRAVIDAAEELGCPIILNHAQGHDSICDPEYGIVALEDIAPIMKVFAERAKVPVAVHIDHCLDDAFARRAIRAGFTSIMYDRSALPLEQNIALTKKFVEEVAPLGITVEGEIGAMPNNMPTCVPGQEASDLSDLSKFYTKPEEAKAFAEQTGVDVMTVSIGTVHGMYLAGVKSDLQINLIKEIRESVTDENVHLGMHGCSGTEYDQVVAAVDAGIRKINYFTAMDTSVTPAIAAMLKEHEGRPMNYSVLANKIAYEELKKGAKKALEMFMASKK